MTPNQPDPPVSRGRPVPIHEALPPIDLEAEYYAPELVGGEYSRGRPVPICEALPPVSLVMEDVPALELVPALPDAGRVTAAVAQLMQDVFVAGGDLIDWSGVRVGSPRPGVVTLTLAAGGPEAEERLRELARRVSSPTLTATVVPAA